MLVGSTIWYPKCMINFRNLQQSYLYVFVAKSKVHIQNNIHLFITRCALWIGHVIYKAYLVMNITGLCFFVTAATLETGGLTCQLTCIPLCRDQSPSTNRRWLIVMYGSGYNICSACPHYKSGRKLLSRVPNLFTHSFKCGKCKMYLFVIIGCDNINIFPCCRNYQFYSTSPEFSSYICILVIKFNSN